MSTNSDFYLARAAECARDAEASSLDNVRDRCRRSQAAWQEMADRVIRGEKMRDTLDAAKAVREEPA
jgi:hypothetical protein